MDEGVQNANVIETRFGVSPARKTPRLEVKFQLEKNETIWGHIYFKNKEMARKSIRAIGFDIDNRDLGDLRNDSHLLTGNECEVELEDDPQYGMKVKWINALGGNADLDLTKLTTDLRNAKKKGKSGPAPEPAGSPPPEAAEDIPF